MVYHFLRWSPVLSKSERNPLPLGTGSSEQFL